MKPKPPFIRSAYNYDMDDVAKRTGIRCQDKSLAQQEFKEETNINYIANRYGLTGELPQVLRLPEYGDFTGIFDFQTAQNAVRGALEQFMTLPAKMRARFHNSPQELLQFLEDPDNRKEAIALGLVKETPPQPPTTPAAPPATPKAGETPTPPAAKPAEGTPTPPSST